MNAIVFDASLRYEPRQPDPQPVEGEALIAVRMAGICSTDLEITKGYMGFRGVLGHEFVGTVVKGGKSWRGKRVVAEINCVCGRCEMCQGGLSNHCRKRTVLGIAGRNGVFADLVTVPERNLHEIPDSVPDDQAVFVEPLAAAFQVIKQFPIEKRMRVVVVGTGRLGLLIAQVLRTTGCQLEVIGRNPSTLDFCDRKGIQARNISEVIPREDRELVVEATGSPAGFELATKLVRPRGTIILKSTYVGGAEKVSGTVSGTALGVLRTTVPDPFASFASLVINEVTVLGSRCGPFPDAIAALARRQIDVETMISKTLPLSRGVDAFELAADPRNIKILLKVGG